MFENGFEQSDFKYALEEVESNFEINPDYALSMYLEAEAYADNNEITAIDQRRLEKAKEELFNHLFDHIRHKSREIDTSNLDYSLDISETWSYIERFERHVESEELPDDYEEMKHDIAEGYETLHQFSMCVLADQIPLDNQKDDMMHTLGDTDEHLRRTSRTTEFIRFSQRMAEELGENYVSDSPGFDAKEALDNIDGIAARAAGKLDSDQKNLNSHVIQNLGYIAEDYGVRSSVLDLALKKSEDIMEMERTLEELDQKQNNVDIALEKAREKLQKGSITGELEDFYEDQLDYIEEFAVERNRSD